MDTMEVRLLLKRYNNMCLLYYGKEKKKNEDVREHGVILLNMIKLEKKILKKFALRHAFKNLSVFLEMPLRKLTEADIRSDIFQLTYLAEENLLK